MVRRLLETLYGNDLSLLTCNLHLSSAYDWPEDDEISEAVRDAVSNLLNSNPEKRMQASGGFQPARPIGVDENVRYT